MNYIVFDLEWNQNPSGKKTRNDRLPFEIIEIGAVKVNTKKEITDHFHRLIKPQVYKWIHDLYMPPESFCLRKAIPDRQNPQILLKHHQES